MTGGNEIDSTFKILGNIVDPSWWTDLIGEKSGAYDRASKTK